jgi:ADP-ribosyl-[dinitrogen reductase] hydrolase
MPISPLSARLRAMFTGGAIGDAFGAPIEILKRSEILDKFGPAGLTYMAPYDAGWLDADTGGVGTLTDDTTMLAVTLDALNQTWG